MKIRYRLPGSGSVETESECSDIVPYGPFDVRPFEISENRNLFPERSTTREEHRAGVERILHEIEAGNIEKCVLARTIVKEGKVDIDATFRNLCDAYPNAFVFMFKSLLTGTWMGATPELLLSCEGNMIRTMALAGTRTSGECANPEDGMDGWDEKNIREQRFVTEHIMHTLKRFRLKPEMGETTTLKAGPVEHLMTPISATISDDELKSFMIGAIAHRLSPTPAVCGIPRNKAMELIKELEGFDRGYYGGFLGPRFENGDCQLFVNLRSMRIEKNRYALYTGSGIVSGSDPDEEWEETERKAQTLLQCIVHK